MENVQLSVADFVALVNQTLEYAYPTVSVVGEVAEFRVSQGKWVSFKLKGDGAIVDCFTTTFNLRVPLEDGMKVLVVAAPRINAKWGKFSLQIRTVKPMGEGAIKKSFDLLKAKLEAEGLFSPERKRPLPRIPQRVGVITSAESAAYADFCKIINQRWGGLEIEVAHTQVQGDPAADQIIGALRYFNAQECLPEVIVVIRGGGSAEDLQAFNDERLARAIAESRVPTLVGVGHEVDHTLADMISDVRAATPTAAAEILVPDKHEIIRTSHHLAAGAGRQLATEIDRRLSGVRGSLDEALRRMQQRVESDGERLSALRTAVQQLNPQRVLERGYALVRGEVAAGSTLEIETEKQYITAEVRNVREK